MRWGQARRWSDRRFHYAIHMVVGLPEMLAPSRVAHLQVDLEYQWNVVGESVCVDRVWVNPKRSEAAAVVASAKPWSSCHTQGFVAPCQLFPSRPFASRESSTQPVPDAQSKDPWLDGTASPPEMPD